ncbi:hypothetical protein BASA81_006553 [Batrachochytrium salamandrivorans]|nr:hypothetical protein BASA81_006553 [Batrachochytrium salamandrivorans]
MQTPHTPPAATRTNACSVNKTIGKTSVRNAQSLKKLRRSNYILERILSEQRLKECRLENDCRVLQESLRKTKRLKLKTTVRRLSSNLFLILVCLLLWGNWIMFSPHLDPIVMACLVCVLVSDLQAGVMRFVDSHRRHLTSLIVVGLVGTAGVFARSGPSLALSQGCCGVVVLVLAKCTSSHTMTAIVLTLGILIAFALPLAVVFRSCVDELDVAQTLIFNTVLWEEDEGFLANRINLALAGYVEIDPVAVSSARLWVKANLFDGLVNSQSALGVMANFSNLSWSFGTFAATLFSLLQLDLAKTRQDHMASSSSAFSPFSAEDNLEIYDTIRTSTWEVFSSSLSMGVVNGVVTYGSLWAVGSPLLALPAFASSVLAVLPLFGSYVAVLPIAVGFYLAEMPAKALFIGLVHVITTLVVNPVLLLVSQGGSRFLGGLPIVAGLYAFGVGGIVFGPLIVGLTGLTINIYSRAFHGEDEDEDDITEPGTLNFNQTTPTSRTH